MRTRNNRMFKPEASEASYDGESEHHFGWNSAKGHQIPCFDRTR